MIEHRGLTFAELPNRFNDKLRDDSLLTARSFRVLSRIHFQERHLGETLTFSKQIGVAGRAGSQSLCNFTAVVLIA